MLLKEVDEIGKDYIENFIKDFLNISDQTLEANYKVDLKGYQLKRISKWNLTQKVIETEVKL